MELDDIPPKLSDDGEEDDFERFDDDEAEIHDEPRFDDGDSDSDLSMKKDDTEEELERLVFGDTAGFKQDIKTWKSTREKEGAPQDQSLTAIDDGEVWLISGTSCKTC